MKEITTCDDPTGPRSDPTVPVFDRSGSRVPRESPRGTVVYITLQTGSAHYFHLKAVAVTNHKKNVPFSASFLL